MDEFINMYGDRWPEITFAIIIFAKLFQSQLAIFVPSFIKDHFSNRAKLKADQQEHEQSLRQAESNLTRLREMSQLSSLSFTEEQLTQLTAETQVQLNEANSFIRQLVSEKLDMILEKQNMILVELRRLIELIKKDGGQNGINGNDTKKIN